MHAKKLALLFVCAAACGAPANKGSAVPAKTAETTQTEPAVKPEAVAPDAPPEPVELTEEEMDKLVTVLYAEGIGPIAMSMPASEVIAAIGKPKSKGKEEMWEATGELVQSWNYKGAKLYMARESKKATQTVEAIEIEKESALATKRGIRVGSARADVERAYAKERSAEESEPETFVAGSVYGGLLIGFENDVVISMFLGAAAE